TAACGFPCAADRANQCKCTHAADLYPSIFSILSIASPLPKPAAQAASWAFRNRRISFLHLRARQGAGISGTVALDAAPRSRVDATARPHAGASAVGRGCRPCPAERSCELLKLDDACF